MTKPIATALQYTLGPAFLTLAVLKFPLAFPLFALTFIVCPIVAWRRRENNRRWSIYLLVGLMGQLIAVMVLLSFGRGALFATLTIGFVFAGVFMTPFREFTSEE